jgi:hypothetical protein
MGMFFGRDHAVTDVSRPNDLYFYQWGRYNSPTQVSRAARSVRGRSGNDSLRPPDWLYFFSGIGVKPMSVGAAGVVS